MGRVFVERIVDEVRYGDAFSLERKYLSKEGVRGVLRPYTCEVAAWDDHREETGALPSPWCKVIGKAEEAQQFIRVAYRVGEVSLPGAVRRCFSGGSF